MTDYLTEALGMLDWESRHTDQSASLSSAECQAILDELQRHESAPLTDLLETES